MTQNAEMASELPNRVPTRKWLRRARRPLMAALPAAVWVLAIAGAFQLHRQIGAAGPITGFADDQAVTLAHLEPGLVRDVHVQLYDQVARGQMLISMDDRQERIQLDAIERDVERLRAEVIAEKARLSAENARAAADVADLARRFAIDRAVSHIAYLSELVGEARDRILLRGATVDYELVRDLHERGSAAFRELNDIQTEMDSLRAALARKTELVERKRKAFQEADQRWGRFVERDEVAMAYEPVLTPLRLAIDVRQRDIEGIVWRIDAHVLRAPIDGQVTVLLAHAREPVEAGTPLVTISPVLTSRVVAYLPEEVALSAKVGMPVSVSCLAAAGSERRDYPGTIISLAATVSEAPPRYRQSPSYPVWGRALVVALSEDVRLIPGEAITISLSDRR